MQSFWRIEERQKMKNSVSDHSFYIESDEEDEHQEKQLEKSENGDGNESDSSGYSNDDDGNHNDRLESKPSSFNPAWPQSYRYSKEFLSVHLNILSWNIYLNHLEIASLLLLYYLMLKLFLFWMLCMALPISCYVL